MNPKEIVLTEAEEAILPASVRREPYIKVSPHGIYFSKAFVQVFSPRRISISKSGPYIVFREAKSTCPGSYSLTPGKGGSSTNAESLMRVINPEGRNVKFKPLPVKGGGWAIRMY